MKGLVVDSLKDSVITNLGGDVWQRIRKRIPNAQPPKLHYDWKDEKIVIMGYESPRDLTELFAGTVKGLVKHYGDEVRVEILDRKRIKMIF